MLGIINTKAIFGLRWQLRKITHMGQRWAGQVISKEASQGKDNGQQFVVEHLKHKRKLVLVFISKYESV